MNKSGQATLDRSRSAVQKTEEPKLRHLADVSVVQAAEFGQVHDRALHGAFDGPEVGCILVEREVGARLMILGQVVGQDAAEMALAEKENVEALAADGADEVLRERVLPRAVKLPCLYCAGEPIEITAVTSLIRAPCPKSGKKPRELRRSPPSR